MAADFQPILLPVESSINGFVWGLWGNVREGIVFLIKYMGFL
jgi:hypothetical protein